MEQQPGLGNEGELDAAVRHHAYLLWERRGGPWGTPEVDWFAAEQEVQASSRSETLESPAVAAAKVVGKALGSVAGLVTSLGDSTQFK